MAIVSSNPSRFLTSAFLAVLVLTGCSRRGLSGERIPVTGTLELDGEPVTVAIVEFSQDAEQGQVQSAVVRDGKFSLDGPSGLPAGQYSVAVLPYVPEVEELSAMPPQERAKVTASQDRIPENYRRRGMLTASIEAGKTNSLELNMESKPR